MKVKVDRALCNGHGECVLEAPDVFELSDLDDVVTLLDAVPDESRRGHVERAAAMCPVAAISIEV